MPKWSEIISQTVKDVVKEIKSITTNVKKEAESFYGEAVSKGEVLYSDVEKHAHVMAKEAQKDCAALSKGDLKEDIKKRKAEAIALLKQLNVTVKNFRVSDVRPKSKLINVRTLEGVALLDKTAKKNGSTSGRKWVKKLHRLGTSVTEIQNLLRKHGFSVSRSTLIRWLNSEGVDTGKTAKKVAVPRVAKTRKSKRRSKRKYRARLTEETWKSYDARIKKETAGSYSGFKNLWNVVYVNSENPTSRVVEILANCGIVLSDYQVRNRAKKLGLKVRTPLAALKLSKRTR